MWVMKVGKLGHLNARQGFLNILGTPRVYKKQTCKFIKKEGGKPFQNGLIGAKVYIKKVDSS